jgi:membrane fusion protein, multidrug efflux system
VIEVLVNPGASVHKGDPLLRFDPLPLQAAVVQATAQSIAANNALLELDKTGRTGHELELRTALAKAKSQATLARNKLALVEKSRAEGLVSERAGTEAREAATQADDDLALAEQTLKAFQSVGGDVQRSSLMAVAEAAQATLHEAELALAQATVTAPADGQLAALAMRTGDRADAGAALGTIVMAKGRVVSFGVSAAAAPQIKVGATVEWTRPDGKEEAGKVQAIQAQVDPATGLVEVLVAPEKPTDLPLGLMLRGEIETGELPEAILVPRPALIRHEDNPAVVTVGANHLAKVVAVKVLGEHGEQIAVEGEVKAGDKVIVEGGYNLPDGAKVHEGAAATQKADEHDAKAAAKEERPSPPPSPSAGRGSSDQPGQAKPEGTR